MFRKLSLLSFILITAPSYMIDSTAKEKTEKKINDIRNIPNLIASVFSAVLLVNVK